MSYTAIGDREGGRGTKRNSSRGSRISRVNERKGNASEGSCKFIFLCILGFVFVFAAGGATAWFLKPVIAPYDPPPEVNSFCKQTQTQGVLPKFGVFYNAQKQGQVANPSDTTYYVSLMLSPNITVPFKTGLVTLGTLYFGFKVEGMQVHDPVNCTIDFSYDQNTCYLHFMKGKCMQNLEFFLKWTLDSVAFHNDQGGFTFGFGGPTGMKGSYAFKHSDTSLFQVPSFDSVPQVFCDSGSAPTSSIPPKTDPPTTTTQAEDTTTQSEDTTTSQPQFRI